MLFFYCSTFSSFSASFYTDKSAVHVLESLLSILPTCSCPSFSLAGSNLRPKTLDFPLKPFPGHVCVCFFILDTPVFFRFFSFSAPSHLRTIPACLVVVLSLFVWNHGAKNPFTRPKTSLKKFDYTFRELAVFNINWLSLSNYQFS